MAHDTTLYLQICHIDCYMYAHKKYACNIYQSCIAMPITSLSLIYNNEKDCIQTVTYIATTVAFLLVLSSTIMPISFIDSDSSTPSVSNLL